MVSVDQAFAATGRLVDFTGSGRPCDLRRRSRPPRVQRWAGMAKTTPFEFLQQVRSEAAKVTWPTRKETLVTTGMVFVMVVVASLFFLLSDQIIRWVVGLVLGVGR
jgi:preprotein translocase subunit SecE